MTPHCVLALMTVIRFFKIVLTQVFYCNSCSILELLRLVHGTVTGFIDVTAFHVCQFVETVTYVYTYSNCLCETQHAADDLV